MRVLTAPWGWYPDDINSKLNFDEFTVPSSDEGLFIGISCTEEPFVTNFLKNTTNII